MSIHRARLAWWRAAWLLAIVSAVVSPLAGCVQRRMTIRTKPPGAMVYVDDFPIGVTPVSTDFVYYGTREIRLEKDGFQTLTVKTPIRAPWYQYPPLDFVTENLWPVEIRDERTLNYQLEPQRITPFEELVARGQELRANTASYNQTVPPPVNAPGVQVAPAGPPVVVPGTVAPGTVAPESAAPYTPIAPPQGVPIAPPPGGVPTYPPPPGPSYPGSYVPTDPRGGVPTYPPPPGRFPPPQRLPAFSPVADSAGTLGAPTEGGPVLLPPGATRIPSPSTGEILVPEGAAPGLGSP